MSIRSILSSITCTALWSTKPPGDLIFTSTQFPLVTVETRQVCSPVRHGGFLTPAQAFLLDLMTKTACQDVELTPADYLVPFSISAVKVEHHLRSQVEDFSFKAERSTAFSAPFLLLYLCLIHTLQVICFILVDCFTNIN